MELVLSTLVQPCKSKPVYTISEMSCACGTYVEEHDCTRFSCRDLKESDNLEYKGVDGKMILKHSLKKIGWARVYYFVLAQDREKC